MVKGMRWQESDRYVVLVWLHDHWGVTISTNDRDIADDAVSKAQDKVNVLGIDTLEETTF